MLKINKDLSEELKKFTSSKSSFMTRLKKTDMKGSEPKTELGNWLYEKERTCYVCDHFESIYGRYLDTFFHLYKKGHWASVFNRFNNLLHSLASRVLKAFLRAYFEILVLAEPFTKQPVLVVDNNFKTDQLAFFRSGIWVLLKTVGRVHSMM